MSGSAIKMIVVGAGVVGVLGLAGCAAPRSDSGFGDVQRITSERTGHLIQWDNHGADDRAVQRSIGALLAEELTADTAVQVALLNNHHLQATFEDLGIAQADLVQAGLLKNPVFDLGVRIPTTPPSRTYVDVNVAEDFIGIFFIPARKRLANAQFEQVKSRVTGEVLSLASETKSAFYASQAAQQIVGLRRSAQASTAAGSELSKRLHDAGNITDLEFLNAKAQDARALVELLDSEADAAEARERLSNLMGVGESGTEWTIANGLPELPSDETKLDGLETLAIRQRSDLEAAWRDMEVQSQALGFTKETWFLTQATVGAEGERETDGQWRIGPSLSMPLPIFDQGQGAVPRAQAMLMQSQQRFLAMAVDVQSQVRTAYIRMRSARRKAGLYHEQLIPLQNQVIEQTQLEYNGMLVGVSQLLQAKQEQIELTRQYIEAMRSYWIERAELERAVGGRLAESAVTQPTTPEGVQR
jgi:outer membrane protein, heavy metal efflux system